MTKAELMHYLTIPRTIHRMEAASDLGRPAVEVLSADLLVLFGEEVRERTPKQIIGRMVKAVMASRGYSIVQHDVRDFHDPNNVFKSGVRYGRVLTIKDEEEEE